MATTDKNNSVPKDGSSMDNVHSFVSSERQLSLISFNMHGYNQGSITMKHLQYSNSPDGFLLQEHWLTPSNICKFNEDFPGYFAFGSSAMVNCVSSGVLRGRPFGGVMILIKNNLCSVTEILCASDRLVIVRIANMLIVNIYLPCVGTIDRISTCDEIFSNILFWREKFGDCICIVGGDFNSDLNDGSAMSDYINSFLLCNSLYRCGNLTNNQATYVNEALCHSSTLDYFFTCEPRIVLEAKVLDPDINYSDHLPIMLTCTIELPSASHKTQINAQDNAPVDYLRWDHADLLLYYFTTGQRLQPVLEKLREYDNNLEFDCDKEVVDNICNEIINILCQSADLAVPRHKKNFYKFWWNQELDSLKHNSIATCRLWKSSGRPRSGPVSDEYKAAKAAYKLAIRNNQREEISHYTNDLHESLINKKGSAFWKCWRSKFNQNKRVITQVDGSADKDIIVEKFAQHFALSCTPFTTQGSARLKAVYDAQRSIYCGTPLTDLYCFDAEVVEKSIGILKRGKAADLDKLTAEHLQNCHPILSTVLSKLFNLIVKTAQVPISFCHSYTVPLIKSNYSACSKSLTVNDFRGISISSIISKIFEHCILDRFGEFFVTTDNQYGFKKNLGCTHAIYTARRVIEHYISNGSTVNLCALDLSKAFDKMNHNGLFINLMKRLIPVELLNVFENWFSTCYTSVKWFSCFSSFFKLECGVRQGGVLSPYLFAVFIDNISVNIVNTAAGCYIDRTCVSIILYADDILLIAPSVTALQRLINVCATELAWLDMSINCSKSVCVRVGPRFNSNCVDISLPDGQALQWVSSCRYLGVYLLSAAHFKCSISDAKKSFYRSFNAIFGKIGRIAAEDVIIELIIKKSLPALIYALEVCALNKSDLRALDYVVDSAVKKIFNTYNKDVIAECRLMFNLNPVSEMLSKRERSFSTRYFANVADNGLCAAVISLSSC